jgi:hypothetical protein
MLDIKSKLLKQYYNFYNFIPIKNQLFRGEYVPSFANKILIYYNNLYCNPNSIIDGDIVYCDTHQILQFKEILNLRSNLTIITHNSDYFVCDGEPNSEMGINVNLFTCYAKWYAQNCYSTNKRLFPIPIGFENKKWEKKFGPKSKLLQSFTNLIIEPKELIYFNCNINTNYKERKECFDFSVKSKFVNIDQPNLLYSEYLKKIKQHKFILSPKGNGLDCHRTWEILKLKRIPILKREGQLEKLYKNIPILFVDNWYDLDNINLNELYKSYDFMNQDYLTKKFWCNFCKSN